MFKPRTLKERKNNAKKLAIKNVLNDKKYHEIFQNSSILLTQFKLQRKIFKLLKF